MKKLVLALSILTGISGCTINGKDQFTCPDPEKGVCMPAAQAYVHAESGRDANDVSSSRNQTSDQEKIESNQTSNKYSDIAPVAGLMTLPLSQPKPILMPAQVLKAWVNGWEDDAQILHMPQVAYVEITPRRWNIDDSNVHQYKSASAFKRVKNSQ